MTSAAAAAAAADILVDILQFFDKYVWLMKVRILGKRERENESTEKKRV